MAVPLCNSKVEKWKKQKKSCNAQELKNFQEDLDF